MRTIFVGDVHGCREELDELLDRIAFASGDRIVFVGDLVARGPDSLGVLDVARRTGAVIVRGNHEQKLLDWRASLARPLAERVQLGPIHLDVARALRPVDWVLLETSPLYVDLPEHDVRVVHAGLVPGTPIEQQDPNTLMRIRTVDVDPDARGARDGSGQQLWATRYGGPPHVVFGHNALAGLQLHPWATGLDTGCVYGRALTALVLAANERLPGDLRARQARLVSTPARRAWFVPKGA
jgi:hypothetical protein